MIIAASLLAGSDWTRRITGFVLFFCLWYAGATENTMSANLMAAVPAMFTTVILILRNCAIYLWRRLNVSALKTRSQHLMRD